MLYFFLWNNHTFFVFLVFRCVSWHPSNTAGRRHEAVIHRVLVKKCRQKDPRCPRLSGELHHHNHAGRVWGKFGRRLLREDQGVPGKRTLRARAVRWLRGQYFGPILPSGCGQAVAHHLPDVLPVQSAVGFRAYLLCKRWAYLLQRGLLQVSVFCAY